MVPLFCFSGAGVIAGVAVSPGIVPVYFSRDSLIFFSTLRETNLDYSADVTAAGIAGNCFGAGIGALLVDCLFAPAVETSAFFFSGARTIGDGRDGSIASSRRWEVFPF